MNSSCENLILLFILFKLKHIVFSDALYHRLAIHCVTIIDNSNHDDVF